jgi:Right handed beta helix region
MRRIPVVLIMVAASLAIPAGASAETLVVDCGAGESLQDAVTAAGGGVVPVFEVLGTCEEQVVLDYPLVVLAGRHGAAIDANGAGNAVTIVGDGVVLRDLVITGAQTDATAETGHGVYVPEPHAFTVIDTILESNQGSGVFSVDAYGTIVGSTLRNNGVDGVTAFGGCCGSMTIDDSRINHNGRYGILGDEDQAVVVSDTIVSGNAGGIFAYEYLHLTRSIVRRNGSGVSSTGRADIVESRIHHNRSAGLSSVRAVNDSVVAFNQGAGIDDVRDVAGTVVKRNRGDGIVCDACDIVDSTITRNRGTGIVAAGPTTLRRSTVHENTAGGHSPGAIDVQGGGELTVVNSTIARNESESGAAFRVSGDLAVTHATIVHNAGPDGIFANTGAISVANSILVRHELAGSSQCTGTPIVSLGRNVAKAPGCAWIGTDVHDPARLGALGDNGGGTETYALLAGSPAIDLVPTAKCGATIDQRGEPRPAKAACDSGSFERQPGG